MITNHDRSGWFGASDASFIMGNWNTKTFVKWWMIKSGITKGEFQNKYTFAGTHYEHKILDFIKVKKKDRQILKKLLRLRVNLDGEYKKAVYEIKTYKLENGFKVSKAYWQQVQVQLFATGYRRAYIVAYGLNDDDYKNIFNPIDKNRISFHEVIYDGDFIFDYLKKLKILKKCLKEGVLPWKLNSAKQNTA